LYPAAVFGPDEVAVLQGLEHVAAAATRKVERLGAEAVWGDEALFKPVTDEPFGLAGCRSDRRDLVGIEVGQRVVGVGVLLDLHPRHCGGARR
jgi:hypothetical protein